MWMKGDEQCYEPLLRATWSPRGLAEFRTLGDLCAQISLLDRLGSEIWSARFTIGRSLLCLRRNRGTRIRHGKCQWVG